MANNDKHEQMDMSHHDHSQMHHEMSHEMHPGHDMNQMTMNGNNSDTMEHGGHMMHMGNLKQKFWVSLILTIPVLLMSPMMGMKLPFQITFQPWSDYLVAVLGTIIFIYGGKPFFAGAKGELADKKPAMMTLIAMGITVSYFYSIYAVIANDIIHVTPMVTDFFWELATLIDIMLLGHWIEMNTVMNAGSAVENLAKLLPDVAHKVVNGKTTNVKIADLKVGDVLQVKAGEQVPADGVLVDGSTSVNEALVTGESQMVAKQVNDEVVGGSVNGDGTFEMKVTGTGDSGYLSQVMKLVSEAQNSKSDKQNMADKVAGYLFYAALTVAIIAFLIWLWVANLPMALSVAVTVLVIACPHALGLAVPLVVARSTSLAAQNGLLIRNRDALEQVNKIDYALMDKTGTLTEGNFKVNDYGTSGSKMTADQVLSIMASLEHGSGHPLAQGILAAAKQHNLTPAQASDINQETGVGLSGMVDNQKYEIVSAAYLKQQHLDYDEDQFNQLASAGNSVSYLLSGDTVLGYVAQGDQIKSSSKAFVASLKSHGITPVMLTGDNQLSAAKVAQQIGITEVRAQLRPEDKAKIVKELQGQGHHVIMIGDGVNDAPSLSQADIGIAIGSGTNVAIDSADVVLVKSNPDDVIKLLDLARNTNRKMMENLWWGAGYNLITIQLAAGVLAPIGFMLNPMVGAAVMSLSTIIVAINALSLRV